MRAVPWALMLAGMVRTAAATDLVEAWNGALQNDSEHAVARAGHAAAQPRRDQATALWRPNLGFKASAGIETQESRTRGVEFTAPGIGQSDGVSFSTSITRGTAGRWAFAAQQPLYQPERGVRQRQLMLSAEQAELDWQASQQALILRTAERYFDLALAEEAVRTLEVQLDAAQRAWTEAQDRFKLGAAPVTDTHEAAARAAGVRAQLLAAQGDVQVKRRRLADGTGLSATVLLARLPAASSARGWPTRSLDDWTAQAHSSNAQLRRQRIAADIARQEAAKYSLQSSPSVELVAQASRDHVSGSGDFGSASTTATNRMIGVQLSVPLFTGGYRSARHDEALRLAEQALEQIEHTRQQVAQQVQAAWLGLDLGAERAQALAEALAASQARLDATQLGHQLGHRTTLDLLNAQSDAAGARLALAQARVALLLDRLRLAALAGGLDEATLRAVNAALEPDGRAARRAEGG